MIPLDHSNLLEDRFGFCMAQNQIICGGIPEYDFIDTLCPYMCPLYWCQHDAMTQQFCAGDMSLETFWFRRFFMKSKQVTRQEGQKGFSSHPLSDPMEEFSASQSACWVSRAFLKKHVQSSEETGKCVSKAPINLRLQFFRYEDLPVKQIWQSSGQIITTSAEVTLNGGLVGEYPANPRKIQVKDL